jgi:uncharacterized protein
VTSRRFAYVIIALVASAAAGCGVSALSKFYTLDSTATPDGAPIAHARVMVGPVTIPAAVDRPEFVVQVAPNRVEVDEFNRWIAPLNDAVARSVAGDLVVMLGTPDVATAPLAGFNPAYQVTIDIQRFDSIRGEAAVLEAVWSVRKIAGNETRSGRTVAREPVQGQGFEALASAHSRAIAKMSGEIAAAVREEAEAKP